MMKVICKKMHRANAASWIMVGMSVVCMLCR